MKFTSLHREPPRPPRREKPGTIGEHHLPVYDHRGNMRGRVGPKATSATVARFGVGHGAELRTVKGRRAWVGRTPSKPQASVISFESSRRAAKGSVTKTPSAPETHSRPRR